MQKPTVGRVVHYYPSEAEATYGGYFRHCLLRGRPHAATITVIHSDTCVNLAVHDANGNSLGRTSITLLQEGDERPANGPFCEWPPRV